MSKPNETQVGWLRGACAALVVGGALIAWYRGELVRQEAASGLLLQADAVAKAIDPAQIQSLSFTPADNEKPVFQQLRHQMAAWAKVASLRQIFSIAPHGNEFVFGPGSMEQKGPMSAPLENARLMSDEQLKLFRKGKSFIQDPVPGVGGAYARAFAPVKNPRTGEVLMLVGIESETTRWDRAVWNQEAISVAFTVGLASLILVGCRLVTNRTQRRSDKKRWLRQVELGVPACFGALLSLAASLLVQERENTARRDLFLQLAASQTAAFKAAEWDIRSTLMVGMAKYLEDDRKILPEEFHYYVHSLVRSADLQALEWIPCVPAAERAQVEADARRRGSPNFVIFQRDQRGERMAAPDKPIYYPVLYAEPSAGNEQVIGWDVGSEPAQRAALEQAGQTGMPMATDPIVLSQTNVGEKAFAVFHPIYVRESAPETGGEDAKRAPVGYSLALVRCSALLERVMANLAAGDDTTSLDWYQLDSGKAPVWLASWPQKRHGTAHQAARPEDLDQLRVVRPLFSLGKTYAILVTPRGPFLASHSTHAAIVTGVSGLALTVVATWVLAWLRTRNARLEEEVRVRTDLLRVSEESYRRQFSDSLATMLLIDPTDGRIVNANAAAERFYGHSQEHLKTMRISQISTCPETEIEQAMASVAKSAGMRFEFQHRRADGSARFVEVYWSPIVINGLSLYHSIIHDISERKLAEHKLQETHRELLAASHQAGMAEVATNVLHNVGNVLNSLNVSVTIITDLVDRSKSGDLAKVSALLSEHETDLANYLGQDPKGRQIPSYLNNLASRLGDERQRLLSELAALRANVEHIKNIVAVQQSYAKTGGVIETINPAEIIEDALRLNSGLLERYRLRIVREYEPHLSSQVNADKHCVLQILINLIRNASYACAESNRADKCVTLVVASRAAHLLISVRDNGVGIAGENLARIFNHGFTTRKDGHGFGLHSGALGAQKMGGSLRAESDGPGLGAVFTLELPLR